MMLSFDVENTKFNYRTAGIIIHEGKILFQKEINQDFWFLPGGRVEFSETAEQALKRELIEEYNVHVIDSRLIWIVENFFELNYKHFHEIGLYYKVNIEENSKLMNYCGEFESEEKGYLHKWISIQEFDQYNIVPKFIKSKLAKTNEFKEIKHIINKG